jgi:hypothetical protein
MAVLATDDFNRADAANLGANWTAGIGPMQILSNQATWGSGPGSGTDAGETYTGGGVVWPNNQYGQIAISGTATTGAETGIGIILRYLNSNNFYRIIVNGEASNNITVAKIASGSYSVITSRTQAWTGGDTFKAEIQGTTIKVYRNGVQLGADISDSSVASGDVGMFYSSTAFLIRADNFEGGDFAPVGAQNQIAWVVA